MSIELDYFRMRYEEACKSALEVEHKGVKILNFSTAVLIVLTAVGSAFKENLFSPAELYTFLQLILFILATFCMVCAWGHAMAVSKVIEFPYPPSTKDVVSYLEENTKKENEKFLIECYADTTSKVWDTVHCKAKNLEYSQQELVFSAWFTGILAFTSILIEVLK